MSRGAGAEARLPALVALLLLGSTCSAAEPAGARVIATFRCADGRAFTVERNATMATVKLSEVRYRLSRRRSSIGLRYGSGEAALMIDGNFAAFVTETVPDLNDCRQHRGPAA